MTPRPRQITLSEWDERYAALRAAGLVEPAYGGPLSRHLADGDRRLMCLRFDDSAAALRLWNFLLTEEDRLFAAQREGKTIIGTMKDLGTVPVMAYALPDTVAFYPDGAWWQPCVMELTDGLLARADAMGIDESFCPVRAMLGAFESGEHFPRPDLLTCSVGATCDDFSAIAQRLSAMGYPILWWEIPPRRPCDPGEPAVKLPGGRRAPRSQVEFVAEQLKYLAWAIRLQSKKRLTSERLAASIRQANRVRGLLGELRQEAYRAPAAPLGALEMLVAEMLAIHYCSDRDETLAVLQDLLAEVRRRVAAGVGVLDASAARVFWVNPVADLRAMNLLEECGGRVCGTDYMFGHALAKIPEKLPPLEALARTALADPMVGPAAQRAEAIVQDMAAVGAQAAVVSRIPGASHCATEGAVIAEEIRERLGVPVVEIEVAPVSDALLPSLRTRLSALVEQVKEQCGR